MPKHAFILLLCAKSNLLTRDKILFLDIDWSCPMCNAVEELVCHLFFQCSFNSFVWGSIKEWLGLSRSISTVANALKWLKKEARGSPWPSKLKRVGLDSTIYFLWNAHNGLIFEGITSNKETIIRRIKTYVYKVMYPYVLVYFESLALGH